jgi:hypothetical protein
MKLTSTKILLFSILLVLTGGLIHFGVLGSTAGILVLFGFFFGIIGLFFRR